jgi:hypothetical protein
VYTFFPNMTTWTMSADRAAAEAAVSIDKQAAAQLSGDGEPPPDAPDR